MKMSKGSEPVTKSGGMRAHIPASPGNNPTCSNKGGCEFGGNASKHLSNPSGKKGNKYTASNTTG